MSYLKKLGIKTGDAIRMFLKQVCLTQSFPLELKVPNQKTIAAMKELENGGGTTMTLDEFNKMIDNT